MGVFLRLLDLGAPLSKGINSLGEVVPPSERSLQFSTCLHGPRSLTMKTLWGCELGRSGCRRVSGIQAHHPPGRRKGERGRLSADRVFLKGSRGLGGPQAKHALLTVTLNGNWPQVSSRDFGSYCSRYRTAIITTAVTCIEL